MFAREPDFSQPFFEQLRELQEQVPTPALINDDGIASVNCEYTQDFAFGKNCYMTFVAWRVENCLYSTYIDSGKDIVDTMSIFDNTERVYDSIFAGRSYGCRNVYYARALRDCAFCYDCRDCSNCFLSVELHHKQYCYQNKQYSKGEYDKIIQSYHLDTYSGLERAKKEFTDMILHYPRRFAYQMQCTNVIGDDLENCKNVYYGFNSGTTEDARFIESCDGGKNGYDITVGGEYNECYESITPDQSYRGLFTLHSWKNIEVTYCANCHSSKYLFGCSGMKKAEYCILNKQYSKEEYEKIKTKLITHMQGTGEWGEFFPSKYSPFGYNETVAQIYFPMIKDEARDRGFNWQDYTQMTTGKETIKSSEIPNSIHDVSDSIVNDVLACGSCGRNYRIVPQELSFYRTMQIPIPRICFYCRNEARFNFRNPFQLWHRRCTCGGEMSGDGVYKNQTKHFHGSNPCPNEFETSYAPERPEIVYCEACYQNEVQ